MEGPILIHYYVDYSRLISLLVYKFKLQQDHINFKFTNFSVLPPRSPPPPPDHDHGPFGSIFNLILESPRSATQWLCQVQPHDEWNL